MNSSPIIDFRQPADMTLQERRSEIIALIAQSFARYVAERPAVSQVVQNGSEKVRKPLSINLIYLA